MTAPHPSTNPTAADLADVAEYMTRRHYDPDDIVSVCFLADPTRPKQFRSRVVTVSAVPALVAEHADHNVWIGQNPLRDDPFRRGRGGDGDVVALRELYADLDLGKAGDTEAELRLVVEGLSDALGSPPAAIVSTGHGLQPHWPLTRHDHDREAAEDLLARWYTLVSAAAREATGGTADNVYDLARIMRAPWTTNRKKGMPDVHTSVEYDDAATPVPIERAWEVLAQVVPTAAPRSTYATGYAPTSSTDRRSYGELEAGEQDVVDSWLDDEVTRLQGMLIAAADMAEGEADEAGRTWEKILADVAWQLGLIAREPWSPLNLDDAEGIYLSVAPGDRVYAASRWHDHCERPGEVRSPLALYFGEAGDVGPLAEAARTTSGRPLTDLGNAERMVDLHGDLFRYVATEKRWRFWSGVVWESDDQERVKAAAAAMVRHVGTVEAGALEPTDPPASPMPPRTAVETKAAYGRRLTDWYDDDPANATWYDQHAVAAEHRAWSATCEDARRLTAAVGVFSSRPAITRRWTDFDANIDLLNFTNGTFDIGEWRLRPHDPADSLTKLFGCAYEPDAPAPRWEAFLESSLPDPEVRAFLARLVGYAITGRVNEKVIALLLGPSNTGKSIFTRVVREVLGDYAMVAAQGLLRKKRNDNGGGPNPDLDDLSSGARVAVMSELDVDAYLDESLVKQLTGGDRIRARGLHVGNKEWQPRATVFVATNHMPRVHNAEDAIWGRLTPVVFDQVFSDEPGAARPMDKGLMEALRGELPGIAAWILAGLRDYLDVGLAVPEVIRLGAIEKRDEADEVATFLAAAADEGTLFYRDDARVNTRTLHDAYVTWHREENGHDRYVWGSKTFHKRATARLGERVKIGGANYYVGVGLTAPSMSPPAAY